MTRVFDRIRRRFLGAPSDHEAARWRARYDTLREELRAEQQRQREKHIQIKDQSERRLRRIPSTATLRHALQAHTDRARARAAGADIRARRDAFAARTASYRHAIDALGTLENVARRTTIDGLEWWVPASPRQSAASVDRLVAKQSLPYRAISQTRELAIGGVVVDIGGNIGATAIPRAILGDASLVLCAEPDELNYLCLVANVVRNGLEGLVLPELTAISDRVGTVEIARGKMPGSHRIVHASGDESVAVPATTVDAWLARHEIDARDVTFVKVDTQGSEVHVLSGAASLLEQRGVGWQIEIAPWLLRMAGHEPATLYAMVEQHFTDFIDLNAEARGPRLRPTAELRAALEYLEAGEQVHTDVLAYRA